MLVIQYNTTNNVVVDGYFKMYHLIKESSVNDPNLIMDFDGLIDLSKKRKQL
jgi:hypothetical protein